MGREDPAIRAVLSGYADRAAELIEPYEALSVTDIYAGVLDHLPSFGHAVLDVGAATGRDAAWCAARGATVHATEPVTAFRADARKRHPDNRITWIDDALPDLPRTWALGIRFDRILCSGVWHHLPPQAQASAMPVLRDLCAPHARILLSLRHGPSAPGRPAYPCPADTVVALADASGFDLLHLARHESIQAGNRQAGVTWTWLVLKAP
ncbi:class I SAM-dependent methyltransferase [Chachezhania antarctica]|uniref:class I SAM-dependent methyltransferase n=1 Tax=Chachezhania antarctica TaxID=2340860 RepID=UPI0013CED108|nr:class I SAM-dependent methyltransferase [Chachezhania antarctica]